MNASVIYRSIKTIEDTQLLQEDIDTVAKWALLWLMNFNYIQVLLPSTYRG